MKVKQLIQELFHQAGITVNGKEPWDIIVHNESFYRRLLVNAELALGESYMDKWWDCQALDEFFYRMFTHNLENKALRSPPFLLSNIHQFLYEKAHQLLNFQTKNKAIIVGKHHYDIGNELYEVMLDEKMVYSCAYFENTNDLNQAQTNKLKLTCDKLKLKPGMKILDIGCGWGSFAHYAASQYQVSVTGLTISKQQFEYAQNKCKDLPIEIRFEDYRNLFKRNELFDRVVSIGMFEHVGLKNYGTYMKAVQHALKKEGLFLLHSIGTNLSDKKVSQWINKYIFPNSEIPTLSSVTRAFADIFILEHCQNIGPHYDPTLMAWYTNFNQHWENLQAKYTERFRRMWHYYLMCSAASFRAKTNQVWQFLLSHQQ